MYALRRILAPFARRHVYADPQSVGYVGWRSLPIVGVVAFDTGSGLVYRW